MKRKKALKNLKQIEFSYCWVGKKYMLV